MKTEFLFILWFDERDAVRCASSIDWKVALLRRDPISNWPTILVPVATTNSRSVVAVPTHSSADKWPDRRERSAIEPVRLESTLVVWRRKRSDCAVGVAFEELHAATIVSEFVSAVVCTVTIVRR